MPLGSHFGPFLDPLGPLLGRPWGSLGCLLAALGAVLGALGLLLGRSWGTLVRSWGALGPVFSASWCSWVLLGPSRDAREGPKSVPRPFLG